MPRSKLVQETISRVSVMLSTALDSSGISQHDLAAKLNVSEARVSQMLNGDANLTILTLAKIASALKMELKIGLYGKK
jgi:transcriptional regulator with XRE-family HTH domain